MRRSAASISWRSIISPRRARWRACRSMVVVSRSVVLQRPAQRRAEIALLPQGQEIDEDMEKTMATLILHDQRIEQPTGLARTRRTGFDDDRRRRPSVPARSSRPKGRNAGPAWQGPPPARRVRRIRARTARADRRHAPPALPSGGALPAPQPPGEVHLAHHAPVSSPHCSSPAPSRRTRRCRCWCSSGSARSAPVRIAGRRARGRILLVKAQRVAAEPFEEKRALDWRETGAGLRR